MTTTWELMGVCFADAAKAEDLIRDLAFRKELKADPATALAAFVLWRRRERISAPRPAQRVPRGSVRTQPAL